MGYPSLYAYCRQELKFSEAQSYQRILAMRALKDLGDPARQSFLDGRVCASTLADIQVHAKGPEEKKKLFLKIQDKSKKEVDQLRGIHDSDPEFDELFEQVRALYSNRCPGGKLKDLFKELAREKLRSVSGMERKRCEYQDPISGRICGSSFFLERDHIVPKAFGGTNRTENLRTFCRTHNQLAAVQALGSRLMQKYLPKLR
jgi:hypothetical protein